MPRSSGTGSAGTSVTGRPAARASPILRTASPPASQGPRFATVPIAAVEVIVSESRKTLRGSIVTLECVSPALAVVVIHEQEIRSPAIRHGMTPAVAARQVELLTEQAKSLAAQSRQRIEVWSFDRLARRVDATSSSASSTRLAA